MFAVRQHPSLAANPLGLTLCNATNPLDPDAGSGWLSAVVAESTARVATAIRSDTDRMPMAGLRQAMPAARPGEVQLSQLQFHAPKDEDSCWCDTVVCRAGLVSAHVTALAPGVVGPLGETNCDVPTPTLQVLRLFSNWPQLSTWKAKEAAPRRDTGLACRCVRSVPYCSWYQATQVRCDTHIRFPEHCSY